jgi:hypothetical protein
MPIFKRFNSVKKTKPTEASLPVSFNKTLQLSNDQVKIIEFLRKKDKKTRKEGIERLKKNAEARIVADKDKKITKHKKTELTVSKVKFPMPCTITKTAREFFQKLAKENGAKNIVFPEGMTHGARIQCETNDRKKLDIGEVIIVTGEDKQLSPDFFGLHINKERTSDKLLIYYKYPIAPFSLRSPRHKDQGGLTTKIKMKQYFRTEE